MTETRSEGGWLAVGNAAMFENDPAQGLVVEGHKIGLFLVDGELFAIDDECTHGNVLLSDGDLEDATVECPLHGGVFDLRSGKALCKPLERDTRTHEAKIEDGVVYVRLRGAGDR